jgi:hypothetical protein
LRVVRDQLAHELENGVALLEVPEQRLEHGQHRPANLAAARQQIGRQIRRALRCIVHASAILIIARSRASETSSVARDVSDR